MVRRTVQSLKLKRLTDSIAPHKPMLIMCNGLTEAMYFDELRKEARLSDKVIRIVSSHACRLSLVEETVKMIQNTRQRAEDSLLKERDVWVVFDVDALPKGNANPGACNQEADNAVSKAYALHYTPIVSNEAFELWFLLHYEFVTCHWHRDDLSSRLSQRIGAKYEKNKTDIYHQIREMQPTAIQHAQKLHANYDPSLPVSRRTPCTDVHLLVQAIQAMRRP